MKGKTMRGICEASGEIDLATAPMFRVAMRDAIDKCDELVVIVDCSAVTFIDSSGYHALVDGSRHAVGRGRILMVRNLHRMGARVLQICDPVGEIAFEDAG